MKGNTYYMAKIIAISISKEKGKKKHNIPEVRLIEDFGMEGDAHAGKWHRQISLLGIQSIDLMRAKGADVKPGDFAENITVEGLVLYELPVGTQLSVGETAVLEVTQIGKECHSGCEIQKLVGSCIMPTQGIFAKVITGGTIKVGDAVQIIEGKANPVKDGDATQCMECTNERTNEHTNERTNEHTKERAKDPVLATGEEVRTL